MDNSLRALCDAIKKVLSQLKPQLNSLSFIVITGKTEQGKSALLKQSNMEEVPVLSEQQAKLYFNQNGIIVELGETWLINSKTLLQNALRHLNRCNPYIKITGLILCIDVNELLIADPIHFAERKKTHLQLLHRIGSNLGYTIELALMLTKMDTLAGFSEFYQSNHVNDLAQPLGFSLVSINVLAKKIEAYSQQFNQLVELLSQQVINKMHPARSTIKRSLIREFPLQVASLRMPIQSFIQGISTSLFHLHSIFFTSAEQGGVSIDRLNKKIQHEYALVVQDTFPQATNFRAYFVEGALKTVQDQCGQVPQSTKGFPHRPLMGFTLGVALLGLIILSINHYKNTHLIDEATKELLTYESLNNQDNEKTKALYHLSRAANTLDRMVTDPISLPTVHQLKINLHHNAQNRLQNEFFPALTQELEQAITNPGNSPIVRYRALRTYIMLSDTRHMRANDVYDWFKHQWEKNQSANQQLDFLKEVLNRPLKKIAINQQIINDARNYLNALPSNYLYYSIAKEFFPKDTQKIAVKGFNLAANELPMYYTRDGFEQIIHDMPQISKKLQTENWVLAGQDIPQLQESLIQAYSFDYITWWQSFIKKTQPVHYQTYQQGREETQLLNQSNTISELLSLIQQETKPDLAKNKSSFNQMIATQFTQLNLINDTNIKELNTHLLELDRFMSTLAIVTDGGKTEFTITRSRFANEHTSDAISLLYNQAQQLPEPLGSWAKQIAGDAWMILIKNSRQYINQQWQQTVYNDFENTIANRYPFDPNNAEEISIVDFNRFFATHGVLNTFTEQYIKPFLDLSNAQWKPKAVNDLMLPIDSNTLDEIIRANIITKMFFPEHGEVSKIEFSLQKISLDPVIANLNLKIGETTLADTQGSESSIQFTWPQNNATLSLSSIEGNHYELAEEGTWALFKLLEKVNVLVDEQDSSSLQILFEINSNSGRYLLKTSNQINPFTPGILNGFSLNRAVI